MARERILVVDDSPTILKLVQLALTKADYQVTTAAGAEAARAAVRAERPALVLLDSLLPPGGSGTQPGRTGTGTGSGNVSVRGPDLAAELAADPQLAKIPVVVMSAHKRDTDNGHPRSGNVVDAISKP